MRFSAVFAVAGLLSASSAIAAPTPSSEVVKRSDKPTETEILNYALTLEYLERNFYADVLKKFDAASFRKAGYNDKTRIRLQQIAAQEAQHVSFLAGALGDAAVGECTYAFGLTTPKAALSTARLLENVGVSAYLGAAGDITDPAYLAAAASILTVEARHASYLNEQTGASGFPNTYDSGLNYAQVYTLAAPLIVPSTCKAGALPSSIQAFPPVKFLTATPRSGNKSAISFSKKSGYSGSYYGAFISGGATKYVQVKFGPGSDVTVDVPKGLSGLIFLAITTSPKALDNSNTVAFGTFILA